jgi:hypothetical protein
LVGFGKANISPEWPVATIYTQSDPEKRTDNIVDPIWARSTYLSCGGRQAVLISCDLLGLDGEFCNSLRHRIAALGVPGECVTVNCSHTHTSPQTFFLREVLLAGDEYMQMLGDRIVESVQAAMDGAERASVGYGTINTQLNVNRTRNGRLRDVNDLDAPSGPVDNRVKVIRIDLLESKMTGLLVSFACHPLTVSTDRMLISADYPGRLCSTLEALPDVCFAQFLQGCGGDMNPKIHGDFAVVDRYVSLLAQKVKQLYPKLEMSASQHLAVTTASVILQKGPIPTVGEIQDVLKKYKQLGKPNSRASRRAMSWAEDALEAIAAEKNVAEIAVLVQSIRLRNFAIVALPGEVFAQIGMDIEKRIEGEALVLGYSNNAEAGYIPTVEQFSLGGYEVDGSAKYYGLFPYKPETAERLISATVRLAKDPGKGSE